MVMLQEVGRWLGTTHTRILLGTFIVTGLASLALNVAGKGEAWALNAQTLLVVAFLVVAGLIVGSRMKRAARLRLAVMLVPALGLSVVATLVPAEWFTMVLGLAFGWLIAVQFFLRDTLNPEYKTAVKHLRKQEFKEAAQAITPLIEREPDDPQHLNFRAEMYRLNGQMNQALADYQKIIEVAPEIGLGYNGLAEVYLQQKKYQQAHEAALTAFKYSPDDWVAPYNLGMIEDRLNESQGAVEHLSHVLNQGLPDSRHRLLTYLWLARAHYRLGDMNAADEALRKMRKEQNGLKEWQTILADPQAATFRTVLADDVELARLALQNLQGAQALFGRVGANGR
jgi:predicted Zn-dependent protease